MNTDPQKPPAGPELGAASSCARRVERRNLFVHVDDSVKQALKRLAKRSQMTLEQYAGAILSEAAETKPVFKLQAVKVGQSTEPSHEGGQKNP